MRISLSGTCALVLLCLISVEALADSEGARLCPEPAPTAANVVNVKSKGARGNGRTDDTAAIQAAIDEVAGSGGTVLVPDGTYLVKTGPREALVLKSDMALKLSPKTVLKAIPSSDRRIAILRVSGVTNVTIIGGTLDGQRNKLQDAPGLGMGIRINHGASHISVINTAARDMFGDGFLIDGANGVTLCGVTATNNRRQGLSVTEGDDILVKNSVFQTTNGAKPGAGIDLEPDRRPEAVTNVRIQSSRFLDNAGAGILINGKKGTVANVEITRNVFRARQPILIKDATAPLSSSVCGNRFIQYVSDHGGLYAFADPVELSASDVQLTKLARAKATAPCTKN